MNDKRKTLPLPPWAEDVCSSLPPLLTRQEAAAALKCSCKSIDRRIRSLELHAVKNGSRVLIPRLAIVELLGGSPYLVPTVRGRSPNERAMDRTEAFDGDPRRDV